METLLRLAALSLALPVCVTAVRNVYSEAEYLGATTFISYVNKAGLAKLLENPHENLTVFPPTNVAFRQLPPSLVTRLKTDPTFLGQLLAFHVSHGLRDTHTDNLLFPTLAPYQARVNVYQNPAMTTISGSAVLLDGNMASNGKVVILRRVMYPMPTGPALRFVSGDDFDMLLLAFTKAGITSLLNAADITVFAPTNQAFQTLPPGVFSDLLDNVSLLTKVLQTHVIKQVVYSAYVVKKGGLLLPTVSGQRLNVTVDEKTSTLQIGTATVISPDENVSNGVVHVIDKVLLPPELSPDPLTPAFRVV